MSSQPAQQQQQQTPKPNSFFKRAINGTAIAKTVGVDLAGLVATAHPLLKPSGITKTQWNSGLGLAGAAAGAYVYRKELGAVATNVVVPLAQVLKDDVGKDVISAAAVAYKNMVELAKTEGAASGAAHGIKETIGRYGITEDMKRDIDSTYMPPHEIEYEPLAMSYYFSMLAAGIYDDKFYGGICESWRTGNGHLEPIFYNPKSGMYVQRFAVLLDHMYKTIIFVIRGTEPSALADLITDASMSAIDADFLLNRTFMGLPTTTESKEAQAEYVKSSAVDGSVGDSDATKYAAKILSKYYMHEGFSKSAMNILYKTKGFSLEETVTYAQKQFELDDKAPQIICTGHSLGAGVAGCMVPHFRLSKNVLLNNSWGILFAPPPCVSPAINRGDFNLKACIRSYINRWDIVPRGEPDMIRKALISVQNASVIAAQPTQSLIGANYKLEVPGKVYWMYSSDDYSTISMHDVTDCEMHKNAVFSKTMFSDHSMGRYIANLYMHLKLLHENKNGEYTLQVAPGSLADKVYDDIKKSIDADSTLWPIYMKSSRTGPLDSINILNYTIRYDPRTTKHVYGPANPASTTTGRIAGFFHKWVVSREVTGLGITIKEFAKLVKGAPMNVFEIINRLSVLELIGISGGVIATGTIGAVLKYLTDIHGDEAEDLIESTWSWFKDITHLSKYVGSTDDIPQESPNNSWSLKKLKDAAVGSGYYILKMVATAYIVIAPFIATIASYIKNSVLEGIDSAATFYTKIKSFFQTTRKISITSILKGALDMITCLIKAVGRGIVYSVTLIKDISVWIFKAIWNACTDKNYNFMEDLYSTFPSLEPYMGTIISTLVLAIIIGVSVTFFGLPLSAAVTGVAKAKGGSGLVSLFTAYGVVKWLGVSFLKLGVSIIGSYALYRSCSARCVAIRRALPDKESIDDSVALCNDKCWTNPTFVNTMKESGGQWALGVALGNADRILPGKKLGTVMKYSLRIPSMTSYRSLQGNLGFFFPSHLKTYVGLGSAAVGIALTRLKDKRANVGAFMAKNCMLTNGEGVPFNADSEKPVVDIHGSDYSNKVGIVLTKLTTDPNGIQHQSISLETYGYNVYSDDDIRQILSQYKGFKGEGLSPSMREGGNKKQKI